MITLYHAPRTRSVRIVWLLEELGLPYRLEKREFVPPAERFFSQQTPLGKFPVIDDGGTLLAESGAILEYILERYGEGRLAPAVDSPQRGRFLQWVHFAESTAFPPMGVVVWLTRYRGDAAQLPAGLLEAARDRCGSALEVVERELAEHNYLLGDEFSAADIMMGFTVTAARVLGVLDDRYPQLQAYLARLQLRPALQKALAA